MHQLGKATNNVPPPGFAYVCVCDVNTQPQTDSGHYNEPSQSPRIVFPTFKGLDAMMACTNNGI